MMLSEFLKTETREEHARSEKELIKQLRDIRHIADYANILNAFRSCYQCAEQQINRYDLSAIVPDLGERRNSSVLQRDLQQMGIPSSEGPVSDFRLENLSEAAGAIYVMEGSTMGGRIIREMISQSFPQLSEACNFWDFYGPDVVSRWQSFLAHLNKSAGTLDETSAVNGAKKIFKHLHLALQHHHEHSRL